MKVTLITTFLLAALMASAQTRHEITLNENWQFSHDKMTWKKVSVPHDWAIAGPFDKKWDLQTVAIEQNGEKQATEKSGRSGALPWIGEGHYKRSLTIPEGYEHAELLFDGAMAEPTVFINGQKAGYWAYGYNAFRVDITPFVKKGDNLLEVDLKNVEESSRWYPGAGIYRPVKLILNKAKARIDDWGITTNTELHYKTTKHKDCTKLVVEVPVINAEEGKGLPVILTLNTPDGKRITCSPAPMRKGTKVAVGTFLIPDAKLWTPETPYLYKLHITLYDGKGAPNVYDDFGKAIDEKTITIGLRTVRVSREHGFQLNGITRKLKGVCLHHDLGPLGAAVNKAALIRQIKILKAMGCDAIRTSHNMPSQMQMDICDSLGMMVMAESFDMWRYPKCKNGYARFFDEWADRDITNLIIANRNHPSIVMWSIGNEIPEQNSEVGRQISIRLQGLCHSLDPTRPVTQGMDKAEAALNSGFAQVMDVPGFNYRVHKYQKNLEQLPQGFLLGSETASTVSSRGVYKFPVEVTDNSQYASWAPSYDPMAIQKADGQCSSYDVEYCSWSNLPDDDWVWQDDYPWVIGEFVWTGFDYLGEPTPYDEYWPARSSYFGICDLAGLPKDRYFLYRSKWNEDEHTIHLLPHWSWGKARKGKVTPVYCYTDYPTAELFINGKSQGKISKIPKERLDRYRLRWNEVKYEPGELKVIVYDADGKPAGEQTVKTAGKPSKLQLDVWTQNNNMLKADGEDLAFVTVSLTDAKGTLIPDAADQLTFEVSGAGSFEAVCNGDATSLESFKKPTMKLFSGQLVVIVRSSQKAGNITLKVSDKQRGLSESVVIKSMPVTDQKSIVILYENDAHCGIEGYTKIAGLRDAINKSDTAYAAAVCCGDFLQGNTTGAISKGQYIADILHDMDYHALTLGNHEFDYGVPRMKQLLEEAGTPVTCANLYEAGEPQPLFAPYIIHQYGNKKIAFVGACTPETMILEGYSFYDTNGILLYDLKPKTFYQLVQQAVDNARAEGADYVVLLSHVGETPQSMGFSSHRLVNNTRGIDVVLDGHSHEIFEGVKVKNLDGKDITVTQTGTQFANVGKLLITPDGRFITQLIKSKDIPYKNARISAITDSIRQKVKAVTSEVVAHSDYTLVVSDENAQWIVRGQETNAGDLVADAYRYALKADIGFENGGGIRNDIHAGDITYGDIIGMLPYDNTLRRISVTGEQLQQMLTRCTALVPVLDGNFPQCSGLRFTIHSKSHKVSDIEILQEDGSYAPVNMNRTYSVALTNYNHEGGGFFECFKQCPVLFESTLRYYEALSDYLRTVLGGNTGQSYANPQGRIKIVED